MTFNGRKALKSVFNKTTIFVLLVGLNIGGIMFLFNRISDTNLETLPPYENIPVDDTDFSSYNKKYYDITKGDISLYWEYQATLEIQSLDAAYDTYIVDEITDYQVGSVLNENASLGLFEGLPILSINKGRVMEITRNGNDQYEITILNSKNFIVRALVSQYDYYTNDYASNTLNNRFILSDETQINLKYMGIDYQYQVQNGNVILEYSVEDPDSIILPGVVGILHVQYETLRDVYLINRNAFNNTYNSKVFYYKEQRVDGYRYEQIDLDVVYFVNKYAVVSGEGLFPGMRVYDIE